MKRIFLLLFFIAFLACMTLGCGGAGTSDTNSDTQTQADSDSTIDSETTEDTSSSGDSESEPETTEDTSSSGDSESESETTEDTGTPGDSESESETAEDTGSSGDSESESETAEDTGSLTDSTTDTETTVDTGTASDTDSETIIEEGEYATTGIIVMWSGELQELNGHRHPVIDGIPDTQWYLCDGSTVGDITLPDLRDRFVLGADDPDDIGSIGGVDSITLGVNHLPSHQHSINTQFSAAGAHSHVWHDRVNELWDIYADPNGGNLYANDRFATSVPTNTSSEGSHTHSVSGNSGAVGSSTPDALDTLPSYVVVSYLMSIPTDALEPVDGLGESTFFTPEGTVAIWSRDLVQDENVWHPSVNGIPDLDWTYCDGTQGTFDMRGMFVKGVSRQDQIGTPGGTDTIALGAGQLPAHSHSLPSTDSHEWTHDHTIEHDYYHLSTAFGTAIIAGSTTTWGKFTDNFTVDRQTDSGGSHTHSVTGDTSYVGSGEAFDVTPPYYSVAFFKYIQNSTALPKGSIVLWDGEIDGDGYPLVEDVPATAWHLCDGSQAGIPDLRDVFIKGQSTGESLGDTGGANTPQLTIGQIPSHTHGVNATVQSAGEHHHTISNDNRIESDQVEYLGFLGIPTRVGFTESRSTTTDAATGSHNHSGAHTQETGNSTSVDIQPIHKRLAYIICTGPAE